jgi:hypothetical protein
LGTGVGTLMEIEVSEDSKRIEQLEGELLNLHRVIKAIEKRADGYTQMRDVARYRYMRAQYRSGMTNADFDKKIDRLIEKEQSK